MRYLLVFLALIFLVVQNSLSVEASQRRLRHRVSIKKKQNDLIKLINFIQNNAYRSKPKDSWENFFRGFWNTTKKNISKDRKRHKSTTERDVEYPIESSFNADQNLNPYGLDMNYN